MVHLAKEELLMKFVTHLERFLRSRRACHLSSQAVMKQRCRTVSSYYFAAILYCANCPVKFKQYIFLKAVFTPISVRLVGEVIGEEVKQDGEERGAR